MGRPERSVLWPLSWIPSHVGLPGTKSLVLPGSKQARKAGVWHGFSISLHCPCQESVQPYAIPRPHNLRNFNGLAKESSGRVKAGLGSNERCLAVHRERIHYRPEWGRTAMDRKRQCCKCYLSQVATPLLMAERKQGLLKSTPDYQLLAGTQKPPPPYGPNPAALPPSLKDSVDLIVTN